MCFETLDDLLHERNGILRTSDALARGITKSQFYEYVNSAKLEKAAHGIYVSADMLTDELYLLQAQIVTGGITMDSSFNLAVHALVCLSHSGRSLSSEALAENICTNPTRVRRVMAGLKKAGMVETREGLDGGYRLTEDPATLSLRQVAEAVNTRFVDCAWHSGDIDRDCVICSGMAGVMDALYRSMNEECAAYLSHITITDIETQLFTQK